MTESWRQDDAFLLGLPVVAPTELFFSITDRRGVIEQANAVFVRLSRFPREQLIGAPHNLIRHDVMPGGVFRIMWDLLEAGRPVAAYTTNRSADGGAYSVFATIIPVGDRLLSVRSAPCHDGLRSTAEQIYREVRAEERRAAAEGLNRRAVAEYGAEQIMRRLRAAGFASYEDFVRHAVPAEGAARIAARSAVRIASPPMDGTRSTLAGAVDAIDDQLGGLWHTLERYQSLADHMAGASDRVREAVRGLHDSTAAAAHASAGVAGHAPVLERSARTMVTRAGAVDAEISGLLAELDRVRGWLLEGRYRIALTRLHNDMVRGFLGELTAGVGVEDSKAALPMLCAALDQDTTALAEDMASVAALLSTLSRRVDQGSEQLRELRRGLTTWRLMVPRYRVSRELEGQMAPVDQHLDRSHDQLESLVSLARQSAAAADPMDPTALRAAILTVRRAVQG